MSENKRTDSDRAMARLLSDALRQTAHAASGLACPDAEVLAAYAEHNLDASETAQWEQHFSACGRCQKILAVLTVSGEEPLTEAELQRFGRKVAAAELGVPASARREASKETSKKVTPFERPRTAWRWLAPAAGIAAALALWIALRPVPRSGPVVLTAEKTASEPAPVPPADSLEAQATVPAPPAVAERPEQQQQAQRQQPRLPEVAPALKKETAPAAKTAPAPQPSPDRSGAEAPASQVQPLLQAANEAAENPASATLGATATAPAAAAPPAPRTTPSPSPTADAASAVASGAPAASAGAQSPSASSATTEAKPAPNRPVQLFAARRAVGGEAAAGTLVRPTVVITSSSGDVLWRFGSGGTIEHSTDRGQSWQSQTSSVTSDLAAGVAPSDRIAWIAGRAGVILRTTDGEHWQRVPSPNAAANWTSIQATDALHATITSSDQRRFVTADGGQTWKQQ